MRCMPAMISQADLDNYLHVGQFTYTYSSSALTINNEAGEDAFTSNILIQYRLALTMTLSHFSGAVDPIGVLRSVVLKIAPFIAQWQKLSEGCLYTSTT